MQLTLIREFDSGESTTGSLYVNGSLFCYTLEDTQREKKVSGETRIPSGSYQIKMREGSPMAIRYLEKYKTLGMPWLQNVPGFKYVYIHIGNTEDHTEGCILIGSRKTIDFSREKGKVTQKVLNSTETYKIFHETLTTAFRHNENPIFIDIIDN